MLTTRRALAFALAAVLFAVTPEFAAGQPRSSEPTKGEKAKRFPRPDVPHATDAPWRWWFVGGGVILMTIGGTVAVIVLRRAMRSE